MVATATRGLPSSGHAVAGMSRLSLCPRSLAPRCPSRSLVLEPQSAEQLVEVPTVLTPTRIALQIAEQIVDTPLEEDEDSSDELLEYFCENWRVPGDPEQRVAVSKFWRCQAVAALQRSGFLPVLAV